MPEPDIKIVFLLIATCSALYENCDYYQQLEMGKNYYVYSPKYPEQYLSGSSCRWYAVSPPGSYIDLICENFEIPPSTDCFYDRLTVAKTGSYDLSDGINYCGKGSVAVRSIGNRMNIAFTSPTRSPGGRFLCTIRAQRSPPEDDCECGWKNQERIVGGLETGVNEFPMMAGLVDGVDRELFCGATIISTKYAVTAAHCLTWKKPLQIALLVGDHDISVGSDTDSAKLYLIDKFIVHSSYNTVTHVNDIGLVRVQRKIEFNRRVGPVCLPFLNVEESFVGEPVTALGWGALRFGGIDSGKLMKVDLDVASHHDCYRVYGHRVTNAQICTYKENKDACQNDSGGPVLWKDSKTGRMKLLGIISYGIQCATANPSVNTRVTSYVNWIRSMTGEEYCVK